MMKWISLYSIPGSNSPRTGNEDCGEVPCERWGHASVIIGKTLYIISGFNGTLALTLGTYLNDFWTFSFETCRFALLNLRYADPALKKFTRSHHTASYHAKTQSIYLFGGSVNYVQYNDLVVFHVPSCTLGREKVKEGTVPRERTYHAGDIIEDSLLIAGGESNAEDLQDLWVFSINEKVWISPDIEGKIPKRQFLSSTGIDKKLYLFGGCCQKYKLLE
eukprot:TRINITY_DN14148_c0_g9_i1.p1 TRINITY_DN14148_c0_g9~~TRINITY_DN14148_c0_g9_i1.p1  ORF type:complete len:219 (-),score=30.36 TRINITY_DN14148_c0_g9_i1:1428-2084(-)